MKNFWIFIKSAPATGVAAGLAALAQILGRVGICTVDEATINSVTLLLLIVAAFASGDAQWPKKEDPPKA